MNPAQELLNLPPYSLPQAEKQELLLAALNDLTERHRRHCCAYGRLISVLSPQFQGAARLSEVPCLPVGLFKSHRLVSVKESEIFKTMTSSGTSSSQLSRIYLDRRTAQLQTQALARIMTHFLGPKRLPMIIVDSKGLVRDRRRFSARGAAVLGMMSFGRNHFYALDERMELDRAGLERFLGEFGQETFLVFGFTFLVWKRFFLPAAAGGLDLSEGILVHGGGWKKLHEEAVGNDEFKAQFLRRTGLSRIHNYYGMVEQVGSVFVEGKDGRLHPPNFADVIIRDPESWDEAPVGAPGVVQVLSVLPRSYPGHSILTEDIGVVHSIDSGDEQMQGKSFSILGRVPKAELRGCSDVIAAMAEAS